MSCFLLAIIHVFTVLMLIAVLTVYTSVMFPWNVKSLQWNNTMKGTSWYTMHCFMWHENLSRSDFHGNFMALYRFHRYNTHEILKFLHIVGIVMGNIHSHFHGNFILRSYTVTSSGSFGWDIQMHLLLSFATLSLALTIIWQLILGASSVHSSISDSCPAS